MSIEDVIERELSLTPDLWPAVWRGVYYDFLAQQVLSSINLHDGHVTPGWERFDNAAQRSQSFVVSPAHVDAAVWALLAHRPQLNALIVAAGFKRQSITALRRQLEPVVVKLAGEPTATAVVATNPFPQVWAHVANRIAARIAAYGSAAEELREDTLLTQLLLAAYFQSCELTDARLVEQMLTLTPPKPLGFRGALLRIVERVAPTGVLDVIPPVSHRTTDITLRHGLLSSYLRGIEDEAAKVMSGKGVLHRLAFGPPAPIPRDAQRLVSPQQLLKGRSVAYREYEFAILGHLALSGIEQLLRAWGTSRGVPHLKPSGQPKSVLDWLGCLPCSDGLAEQIRNLYDTGRSNIRNRVMHGGLLEVGAEAFQFAISLANPARYGNVPQTGRSGFRSENVTKVCLDCLEALDAEIASKAVLTHTDFEWGRNVALSPSEVGLGLRFRPDFRGSDPTRLIAVSVYLRAMFPALPEIFWIGTIGWLSPFQQGDTLVCAMAITSIFEALYRLTVHLLGVSVLQKDGLGGHYQYLMLDERHLCSERVVGRIVEHVQPEHRAITEEVLRLAVKFRNSVAHGAVVDFDERVARGTGNLLVKSIIALIETGQHHMIQQAAYFRWEKHGRREGHAVDDWLAAQREVLGTHAVVADL